MSLAGQFTTFCCTHEQPINEESCAAFLMAIVDVAPSTRPRYARMLRSVPQMNRTPLDMMILRLQKIAARTETQRTRQARPQQRKGWTNISAAGPIGRNVLSYDLRV
ncbi:hypothetical protein TCDM_09364 [Trypanosoma cruzi Dm28c]|uniref:Uncharacterized protein n=1 Tax=Trypanosoma cruzi Dm28c TaxID=1416333 RepID=V5AQ81_TRYCR|nr:hypothetical protein TCDM_09364 [Trypanosoma cruzi Dm28c]